MFSTPAVAGDLIFVGSCNGVFHAIDKETGRARWTYAAIRDARPGGSAEFHGSPLVTDDLVVTSTDDRSPGGFGHIYTLERATGRLRWKVRVIKRGVMSDVLRSGSRLYALSLGDELLCLELETGRINWTHTLSMTIDEERSSVMTPVVSNGVVYAGGQEGTVEAVDAITGELRWRQKLGSAVVAPLALRNEDLYVPTSGHLVRLDRRDGSKRAELDLKGNVFGAPMVLGADLIVFVNEPPPEGSCGGTQVLKSLDASLESVRWSRRAIRGWSSSRPYLWQGNVLAGGERGEITAFRPREGIAAWSDRFPGVIRGIGIDSEMLYVGTVKGTIYAYEPQAPLK